MSTRYYSQYGEDAILWSLFPSEEYKGFFLEVGAFDGKLYSNCYSFEKAGWRGICIEAHPDYFEILTKNRPNSICIHAAAGNRTQQSVSFFSERRGVLSSLDNSNESNIKKNFPNDFNGFIECKIPMTTLDTILEELKISSRLDIVSIDVEGAEMLVLHGFSLSKYQPRVLVIEANTIEERQELDKFMTQAGYINARTLAKNIFFVKNKSDKKLISHASVDVPLVHFRHPCDTKGPEYNIVRLPQPKSLSLSKRIYLKLCGMLGIKNS